MEEEKASRNPSKEPLSIINSKVNLNDLDIGETIF
jgi:hypothetical protein